ncbi:uncharacterized protein DSM5745_08609 [Aspergillus mulundensis]|uniref:Uncharacterized protein n=1 Tax=Aspergillus mulundensis TaxID=1810919 RepID=A0A3D8R4A8_9EURO|nr:hypothetical protein DSM5745_08609 [Aspergillus mulundensis]RDW68849.1 hypothetical protein DSM5745_08609 [Aspergillus mulundensis]
MDWVFASCPHRASSIKQSEDYIGELVSLNSSFPSGSVQKISELARAVQAINSDFCETRYLSRAVVCNLVSNRVTTILTEPEDDLNGKGKEGSGSDSDGEESIKEFPVRFPASFIPQQQVTYADCEVLRAHPPQR